MKARKHLHSRSLDLWLRKPAPRYTSYPPAPFFHNGVSNEDYIESLKKLPKEQPVALYVHIPFCKSLCLYCGCNTIITNRPDRIGNYLIALRREIEIIATIIGHRHIESLHFGGGTPNILSDPDMRSLFECLRTNFDFCATREIAMEIDPRITSPDQAHLLANCGVTRVSIGVQDFDPAVQVFIRRVQPYKIVAEACNWLRAADIAHINFDLIYGLPQQTLKSIADTARLACTLTPDRIALFSYAHVPQLKRHQAALESAGIPDMPQRLALDQIARGIFTGHGYKSIGIDHFAKDGDSVLEAWRAGKLHRNFQGYTQDGATPLIGLGASSISQTSDGYFQNERDTRAYQECISNGHLSVHRGFLLSREDGVRAAIIERLMCNLSCDIKEICLAYDFPPEHFLPELKALKPLERDGIIAREGYALCLTTPYRMAIRVVCSFFDDYTHQAQVSASRTA